MNQRFVSILVVFLLITSVSIPAASAQPIQFVPAAPVVAKLVIDGITVIMSGVALNEIAKHLGQPPWDGIAENLENFAKGVSAGLDKLFAKHWIKITSSEGKALMTAVYECWNAGGSSGGKKDDKWYFEARLNHGEIEINPARMNEEQAVKEMKRGKNIMALNKKLADNLMPRVNWDGKILEESKGVAGEKYPHYHYTEHGMRLHCWIWR